MLPSLRVLSVALLSCWTAYAQQPATAPTPTYENLNAVLWIQTAAEYRGSAVQTYRAASLALERALATKHWTAALEQTGTTPFEELPPAIILDLDETVLDNSALQARLAKQGLHYTPEIWEKWVAEVAADSVPGAVAFLNFAATHGVAPIYITNRVCNPTDLADPTLRVLQKLRIPIATGRLICKSKESDPSDKGTRRAAVARNFRILLLIGDDLSDFVSIPPDRSTVAGREQLFRAYEQFWGDRWFLLPNPTYGSWERAVGTATRQKVEMLHP